MKDLKDMTVEELRKNLILEIGGIKGPVDWFDEIVRRLTEADGIIAEATALSGAEKGFLLHRINRMKDLLIQQQKEISGLRDWIEDRDAQNRSD